MTIAPASEQARGRGPRGGSRTWQRRAGTSVADFARSARGAGYRSRPSPSWPGCRRPAPNWPPKRRRIASATGYRTTDQGLPAARRFGGVVGRLHRQGRPPAANRHTMSCDRAVAPPRGAIPSCRSDSPVRAHEVAVGASAAIVPRSRSWAQRDSSSSGAAAAAASRCEWASPGTTSRRHRNGSDSRWATFRDSR
jgi:hypothetical protein